MCFSLGFALAMGSAAASTPPGSFRVLHHFTGNADDGAVPWGSLIRLGQALYGMTSAGGTADKGTVFRMDADGTGFTLLHSFMSGADDGQGPIGSLLASGSSLYGMTAAAGSGYGGTLFQIGADGTGFHILRRFSEKDGKWPWGSLIRAGAALYGLPTYGGNGSGWQGRGTIFRVNPDGTDFRVLHVFSGGPADGTGPHSTLFQLSQSFFGTTHDGGSAGKGILFAIDPEGTNFRVLHNFAGGAEDGALPYSGSLVSSGPFLYGMTFGGGASDMGAVYRVRPDGTDFKVLHGFSGGSEGQKPFGSLVLSGTTLFGMTGDENTGTNGTIFGIQTDGTGFRVMHRFGGTDGKDPAGTLLLAGSTLYGMTSAGGTNDKGVIFALDL
jgi:uncharacterized repeat protein (TIGR03803 family)